MTLENSLSAAVPAEQLAQPPVSQAQDAPNTVRTVKLTDAERAALQDQVMSLRKELNDRIHQADNLQNRAEAVVATNAPSQAHRDYAQKLFDESRGLRQEAYEFKCKLSIAERRLMTGGSEAQTEASLPVEEPRHLISRAEALRKEAHALREKARTQDDASLLMSKAASLEREASGLEQKARIMIKEGKN